MLRRLVEFIHINLTSSNLALTTMEEEMAFEWTDGEQRFLRVFLGKILKRPYAAAWNTWAEVVESQRLYEEMQRKKKIVRRMTKNLDKQPPGERDRKGLDAIYDWALNVHGDIFKKLNESELKVACMNMELQRFKKHEVLFLQGNPGVKYLIIVNGAVSIRIDNDLENTQRKLQILKVKGKEYITRMVSENPGFLGVEVAELPQGKGFGEVALFAGDGLRTASASAAEDCLIIYIPKHIYMDTLKSYHMTAWEMKNKIDFLSSLEIFAEWPSRRVADLSYLIEKVSYAKNASLLEQGRAPEGVWFLVNGEVKVLYHYSADKLRQYIENDQAGESRAKAIQIQYKQRKALSRSLRKRTLRMPKKYFSLKNSKAPYRELAILGGKSIVGSQLFTSKAGASTDAGDGKDGAKREGVGSPYTVVVTKAVDAYFLPRSNLNAFRMRSKGTRSAAAFGQLFRRRYGEYQRRLGGALSTSIFAPRASAFKIPFTTDNTDSTGPKQKPGSGIIYQPPDSSTSEDIFKPPDELAEWHMTHGDGKARLNLQDDRYKARTFQSAVDPQSRQKWEKSKNNIAPLKSKYVVRKHRGNSQASFSRRSLALDRALDNELERHLVQERQRLGVE